MVLQTLRFGKRCSPSSPKLTFAALAATVSRAMEIRIRGRVQEVGFRPNCVSEARFSMMRKACWPAQAETKAPSRPSSRASKASRRLARIEAIETAHFAGILPSDFRIGASTLGDIRTEISPDAAICEACAAEIADPSCPKRWARARGVDIQNHIRGRGSSTR